VCRSFPLTIASALVIGSSSRLRQAARWPLAQVDARVAFEVDYHASDFRIAWSVLMNGTISRLDAAATAAYGDLRLPPVPWPGPASSLLVHFVPQTLSGRALFRTSPN
jgi:hypothetical protein